MPYSGEVLAAMVLAVVLYAGAGAAARRVKHGSHAVAHKVIHIFKR